MKYVSPEYNQQLVELAQHIVIPERFAQDLGQIALFEIEE